ncbi:hypothetical protein N7444_013963 [Penicillium canescens]|nr:hypothetical protein N7444_013963 [Penicillium canescens]
MASLSLPPSQGIPHFDHPQPNTPGNRRSMGTPLPNPPFVFPARDPDAPETQSENPEHRERPALPAFSLILALSSRRIFQHRLFRIEPLDIVDVPVSLLVATIW